jgi:hypothetical protein
VSALIRACAQASSTSAISSAMKRWETKSKNIFNYSRQALIEY